MYKSGINLILASCLALAAFGSPAEAAPPEAAAADIMVVRERILDITHQLGEAEGLSDREVEQLRSELADISVDLKSIADGLADTASAPVGSEWKPFAAATTSVLPQSASFRGWQVGNSMVIRIGGDEDIYLVVTNGNYTAETHLKDVYQGAVKTKATADPGGWVLLEVSDGRGTRQYRIDQGGLGPVYWRGGTGVTKSVSPAIRDQSVPVVPGGKWDGAYLALVHGGELDQSAAFEWLRDQVRDRDYASDALRDLGEYLRQMEGEAAHERLGMLRWFSGNTEKRMDVPDPRVEVLEFLKLINKIYALDSAQDWYRVDLD